jgi:hypothetical protein
MKGKPMTKLTNLQEAKVALIKWINEKAEEKMSDIQLDDESGKTYHFNWDEAFEDTTDVVLGQIEDWISDYDLSYSEGKLLEEFVEELRSDTFQNQIDWAKKVEEEVKLDLNEIVKKTIKDMYEEYKDVEQGEHLYMDEAFKQDFSIEKLLEELKENELFKKAVLKEVNKI